MQERRQRVSVPRRGGVRAEDKRATVYAVILLVAGFGLVFRFGVSVPVLIFAALPLALAFQILLPDQLKAVADYARQIRKGEN